MSKIRVNRIENNSTADGGIDIDASGHVKVDGLQMPTTGALSNRNLVINGAFQVAQRGTTSTAGEYQTVDRWKAVFGGSISMTQSQTSLTSGTPYDEGFRESFRVAVNAASNAAGNFLQMQTTLEAQDIAQSGWKYEDPSHSLTCSFWVKSSLAGTYNVQYRAMDLADFYFNRAFTVTANTWTKVTHTIPGHASLVFNNDNGEGLKIVIVPYYGTQFTANTVSNDTWFSLSNSKYFPDYAQNFGNTANATFEITGVQLEVGSKSTPFEHRSYGDELARCQRYAYKFTKFAGNNGYPNVGLSSGTMSGNVSFPVTMRSTPSLESGTTVAMQVDKWNATGAITRNFRPSVDANTLHFQYYSADNSNVLLAVDYFGIQGGSLNHIFSAEL